MRSFLIRRLFGLVFVLVGVSLVTFILSHVLPADPARVALGGKAGAEQYEAMRERMGLDRPLYMQYASYVGNLLRGDLGYSYTSKRPVRDDLLDYFPASLEFMALLWSWPPPSASRWESSPPRGRPAQSTAWPRS